MWNEVLDIWTKGIDFNLPGNGGPACAQYLSPQRRILEFLLGTTLSLVTLFLGWRLHSRPLPLERVPLKYSRQIVLVTKSLLAAIFATYIVEVGYKFYSSQAIFIFNPCHCLCVAQIVILRSFIRAIDRDEVSSQPIIYLFRIHLYLLHGPFMAVIFPVTNTLYLWGEVETYWIEHALLLLIPMWLLKYSNLTVPASSLCDNIGWGLISYAIWGLFHFLFLQPLASLSLANLNSLLCPAISDPFYGVNYRTWAIMHQLVITLVCGCVINLFGTRDNSQQRKQMLD